MHESVLLLESDLRQGLTEPEVAERRGRYGPNELPAALRTSWYVRLIRQLHHPLIYVLLVSAFVTLLLGATVDAAVILTVVVVNALVGFVQEARAQATLDSLRSMIRTSARVIRAGRQHDVASRDLVPGDLVVLAAGDRVPADLRLVAGETLTVDESALTGESLPVVKDEIVLPLDTPVADRRNMVFSGTLVTAGAGHGLVVATATSTELGEIHRLVGKAEPLETPLTRKLAHFSGVLTVVILGLAAFAFVAGVLRGQDASEMVTAAVALAVGAIPEGLPAAVTITLAIGVGRMARHRAVVRRLPAVETLGSTTVICTDKTGTLTQNEMTVTDVWTAGGRRSVGPAADGPDAPRPDSDLALRACLRAGVCCSDAQPAPAGDPRDYLGDPTEGAFLLLAADLGMDVAAVRAERGRVATVPFSSESRMMATLHPDPERADRGDGEGWVAYAKGAAESIVAMCSTSLQPDGTSRTIDTAAVLDLAHRMASEGLRVIATAEARPASAAAFESGSSSYTLTGMVAMLDPPRPDVGRSVEACHTAGIAVKMITGDHAATAEAIARRIGLVGTGPAPLLTGDDLRRLAADPDEFAAAVHEAVVFARVTPEQKYHLVTALQARGHVVAMTGDGVNDAPALRQADIGIAMGLGGTEVAKDAADMVLTDDDFTTIETAVEEGRGVFDNLTKFIVWTLPTNMGEGMVILVAILLGTALPINPVQILWINMTTAVLLGLTLAFEPKEPGIMTRPPREPSRPLLTRPLMVNILLVSAVLVAAAWWLFTWEQDRGVSLAEARTAAVNLFVAIMAAYLFHCRSLTGHVRSIGLFSNRWVWFGVLAQAAAQLLLTYAPFMNTLFGTAPLDARAWLRIAVVTILASLVLLVHRRLARTSW